MLVNLAMPLITLASGSVSTCIFDLYGAYQNLKDGKFGSFNDAFDGLIGGKGDSFVSCMSEAFCEGATCLSPLRPIKAIYNVIRSFGECAQGQWMDGLVHGFTGLSSFKSGQKLISGLSTEASSWTEVGANIREPLGEMATGMGNVARYGYQNFVSPFMNAFRGLSPVNPQSSGALSIIKPIVQSGSHSVQSANRTVPRLMAPEAVKSVKSSFLKNMFNKIKDFFGSIFSWFSKKSSSKTSEVIDLTGRTYELLDSDGNLLRIFNA
jgi:hypothetical protein